MPPSLQFSGFIFCDVFPKALALNLLLFCKLVTASRVTCVFKLKLAFSHLKKQINVKLLAPSEFSVSVDDDDKDDGNDHGEEVFKSKMGLCGKKVIILHYDT